MKKNIKITNTNAALAGCDFGRSLFSVFRPGWWIPVM